MFRNHGHQTPLEQIQVDPHGPKFARPHPKGESIWHKQDLPGCVKANLKEYPLPGEEIGAWEDGIREARALARSVGMKPDDHAGDIDLNNGDDPPDYTPDGETVLLELLGFINHLRILALVIIVVNWMTTTMMLIMLIMTELIPAVLNQVSMHNIFPFSLPGVSIKIIQI